MPCEVLDGDRPAVQGPTSPTPGTHKRHRKIKEKPPRRLWSVLEAAEMLDLSRATIWRHAANGKIKLTRLAGRTFVSDAEVDRVAQDGF